MKRSVSSPAMFGNSMGTMKKSRSSTNLCALAAPVDAMPPHEMVQTAAVTPPSAASKLAHHMQLYTLLKAPIHQVDMCLVDAKIPDVNLYDEKIVNNENIREFALCIATPPDVEVCEYPSTLQALFTSRARRTQEEL
jgi:hypothetical protein